MNFVNEDVLCKTLCISRKTCYFWRLCGMPCILNKGGMYRYSYDLEAVKQWIKDNKKRSGEE